MRPSPAHAADTSVEAQICAEAVQLLAPKRFGDDRGWFSETYSLTAAAAAGIETVFVQDNHSYSANVGTIRGLHFQTPPFAQAKLVRCVGGAILDIAVDVRAGSPTFGAHGSFELSAKNGLQLCVPVGVAHAFVTLTPDAKVIYKVSAPYAPKRDGGLRWDDPQIAISWPLPETGPVLSEKDRLLPLLSEFESPFTYGGAPLRPIVFG